MTNMLLASSVNADAVLKFDNVADALGYGLPFSLFAMLVVFGALIIIWGCLVVLRIFCYNIPNAKKNGKKSEEKKSTPAPASSAVVSAPAAVPAPEMASLSVSVQEHSVVAAIVSAISAFRTANGENGAFRVVSFKKRK